jgi:hypothetical protein
MGMISLFFDLETSETLSLPFVPSLSLSHSHREPGLIITSALMIWKSLILFTGSESPVSFFRFRSKHDAAKKEEEETRH